MLDRLRSFFNKDPAYRSKHKALCGLSFLIPKIQRTFLKAICFKSGLLTVSLLSKQPIHHHSFIFQPSTHPVKLFLSFFPTKPSACQLPVFRWAKVLIFILNSKFYFRKSESFFFYPGRFKHALYKEQNQVKPFLSISISFPFQLVR